MIGIALLLSLIVQEKPLTYAHIKSVAQELVKTDNLPLRWPSYQQKEGRLEIDGGHCIIPVLQNDDYATLFLRRQIEVEASRMKFPEPDNPIWLSHLPLVDKEMEAGFHAVYQVAGNDVKKRNQTYSESERKVSKIKSDMEQKYARSKNLKLYYLASATLDISPRVKFETEPPNGEVHLMTYYRWRLFEAQGWSKAQIEDELMKFIVPARGVELAGKYVYKLSWPNKPGAPEAKHGEVKDERKIVLK